MGNDLNRAGSCSGPQRTQRLGRREILRAGSGGFSSLTLSQLMRLRAQAAQAPHQDTAIILVWLRGGASHLEQWDPKPEAPLEFRGP